MVIGTGSRCTTGRLRPVESAPPPCRGWTWRRFPPASVRGRMAQEPATREITSQSDPTEVSDVFFFTCFQFCSAVTTMNSSSRSVLSSRSPAEGGWRLWPVWSRWAGRLGPRRRPQERRTATQRSTKGGPEPVVLEKEEEQKSHDPPLLWSSPCWSLHRLRAGLPAGLVVM